MSFAVKLHHLTHFNTSTMGHSILLAINAALLLMIGLMVLTPVFDPSLGWSHSDNLFAMMMLAGLALVPVSLLLSSYFAKGDPLVCPICKFVAAYNILVAAFLFYHVVSASEMDLLDLAYSDVIGAVAVLNAIVLMLRLKDETALDHH